MSFWTNRVRSDIGVRFVSCLQTNQIENAQVIYCNDLMIFAVIRG